VNGVQMSVEAIQSIMNWFNGVSPNGAAQWFAVAGFMLILAIGIGYAAYGTVRLSKKILNMSVKEFSLFLLVLGIIMIGLAAVLP
jgi:hypothetical protein